MRRVLWVQGVYDLITGAWPLLHMPSFLFVTGPKTDLWLVRLVGALLAVSGAGFLLASVRNEKSFALAWIALGQALVLTIVDLVYVNANVISALYLLDVVPEVFFIFLWILFFKESLSEDQQTLLKSDKEGLWLPSNPTSTPSRG
jgi:hypothetical protein